MSTVGDIVAVLGELDLLINADPGALARRQEILATKSELLERIRGEGDAPVAVAVTPWRDDDATMPCPVCGSAFVVGGRRRYCSDGCRASAWARRRRSSPPPVVVMAPPGPRRPHTVYECDGCGLRALGEQRCEDCGVFMRRIGLGGSCPACDDPVAACELIEVVESGGRR